MGNYAEHLRRFSVTRAQLGKKNKEMLNQAADRIEQLEQENQSPQTSLAEVLAQQAYSSFLKAAIAYNDYYSASILEEDAQKHANKIRNKKDGE